MLKTLQKYANEFVTELKQKAPKSSGALSNSIRAEVSEYGIEIEMYDYGLFLDEGVNGINRSRNSLYSFTNRKPPISSITNFARSIGANPYALQNSIYQKGIPKTNFIKNSITTDKLNNLANDLAESIWDDFTQEIK